MFICGCDLSISSSGVVVEELDDDTLEIKDVKFYGFTQKKKVERENILLYTNKDFKNSYSKYSWMIEKVLEWTKDCSYCGIEDYAMGAVGMTFDLAEFEGNIKIRMFERGQKLRFYAVKSNKKFFTGRGDADKIGMRESFDNWTHKKPDISDLPYVDSGKGVQTTSDVIDAYALCEFLRQELKLKKEIEKLDDLSSEMRTCFTTKTKEKPEGLIKLPFMEK